MKLTQMYLKNFGKFHEKKIVLHEGINLIYGENESGKSTLHSFIRSMLFGMRRGRGRAAAKDSFSKYEPWENSSYYAGSLRFASGDRRFLLERNFAGKDSKAVLICEDDGERLSVEDGDLKMLLGGIGENIFDNTVSLGQMKSQTDEGLSTELRNYMMNYQDSSDGELDPEQAVGSLRERRKRIEEQISREKGEQRHREEQILSRLRYVEEERTALENALDKNQMQLKEQMFHKPVPQKRVKTARKKLTNGKYTAILVAIVIVFLMVLNILEFYQIAKYAFDIGLSVAILWLMAAAFRFWHAGKEEKIEQRRDEPEEEHIRRMQWQSERLREELREKDMLLENLHAEYADYRDESGRVNPLTAELEAVDLAVRTIRDISRQMQKQMGTKLRQRITEIFREVTEGKYTQVYLDENMELNLMSEDHYVPLHQVSRGTMEQVYFALRMAAAEVLCSEEELPVILDDTFAMYDEKRLEQVLRWLAEHRKQVLLFTCHRREGEILDRTGIPYQRIELD